MTARAPDAIGIRVAFPGRILDAAGARLRRPAIDRDDADAILGSYGLRTIGTVRNLPVGRRGRNVVVPTASGRKVLRRYRDQWTVPTIRHEHSILRHLDSVGFPAIRVEPTRSGQTIVERGDGRFALFAFEPGVNVAGFRLPRERRVRLWRLAGALLARFHRATEGFAPEGHHHLGYSASSGGRTRDLGWHLAALEQLMRDTDPAVGGPSEDVGWLRDHAERVGHRLRDLEDVLGEAHLTTSVVHGDYGLHNLLFRRDGSPILLDFELARRDWRLIDIVTVLSREEARCAGAFLEGYEDVAGAPGDEWRYLSEVWEHYRLSGAVQSWFTYARLGDERRLATARRRIEEADGISEHAFVRSVADR